MNCWCKVFVESYETAPEEIILDVDTTDLPLHGKQEGRFFHGYYDSYCYLPLYIFCGDQVLCARLRQSNTMRRSAAWQRSNGSWSRFARRGRK